MMILRTLADPSVHLLSAAGPPRRGGRPGATTGIPRVAIRQHCDGVLAPNLMTRGEYDELC
jgi:hypothetical protein